MNQKKSYEEKLKLSRRSFLKATTGGIAGALIVGTTAGNARAAAPNGQGVAYNSKNQKLRTYSDSLDRTVSLPETIEKVVPSGLAAQCMLSTLCPEKLVAVASAGDAQEVESNQDAVDYIFDLPETGEMYSARRNINTSKIASIDTDVIVDVGFDGDDLKFTLDYLQANTETPAIFVDISFGKLPQAYRTLGELLGCRDRAEILASYIENLYADIEEKRKNVKIAPKVLYAGGDLGLSNSNKIQNDVIKYLGGIPVELPEGSEENQIDANALTKQNIDHVIFESYDCFYSIVSALGQPNEIWSSVSAVQKNRF